MRNISSMGNSRGEFRRRSATKSVFLPSIRGLKTHGYRRGVAPRPSAAPRNFHRRKGCSENPNGIPPQSPGLSRSCAQGRGYPGLTFEMKVNPNGVAPHSRISNGTTTGRPDGGTTPLGLILTTSVTQGSSFLATLGWRTQSPLGLGIARRRRG
jgi:hypothetical protein